MSTPFDPNDLFSTPRPESARNYRELAEEALRGIAASAEWDRAALQEIAGYLFSMLTWQGDGADWQSYAFALLKLTRGALDEAFHGFALVLGLDGAKLIFPEATR